MKKLALEALNDYITEPTGINLKLFVISLNPESGCKSKELETLIAKYVKDQSKSRLKAIENYVGVLRVKSAKKVKEVNYLPKSYDNKKMEELNEIRKRYMINLKRQGSEAAAAENSILRGKMDDLETELGLKVDYLTLTPEQNAEAQQKSKEALVRGVLGDFNDPKSLAFELLHGHRSYFQISHPALVLLGGGVNQTLSDYRTKDLIPARRGVDELISTLEKMSGQKVRKFNISLDFQYGDKVTNLVLKFSESPIIETTQLIGQQLQGYGRAFDGTGIDFKKI